MIRHSKCNEVYDYYKKLYDYEDVDSNMANNFVADLPKLENNDIDSCEGKILKSIIHIQKRVF